MISGKYVHGGSLSARIFSLSLFTFPHHPVGHRPPNAQPFLQSPEHLHLKLVGRGELFYELIANIAMLGVGLAVFSKELNIVLLEPVVVLKSPEKPTAG